MNEKLSLSKKTNFWTVFLIMLLTSAGWGQTVTYDFSLGGAVSGLDATPPIAVGNNIGFSSHKNSGTSNPTIISGQLRLYQNATKGGSIKIVADGVTITGLIVYASGSGGTGPAKYSLDGGSGVSVSYASGKYTISSVSATTIEFYNVGSSNSTRTYVDKFEVTYTGGCSVTKPNGVISGTTPACSSTTLSYAHGSGQPESGVSYYWQSSASGTSTDNAASSTLNISSSGTYYIRGYSSADDCWSTASDGYAVTINTPVTAAITTATATSLSTTGATLNANSVTFGVCPNSIEKGFVYSLNATNATPQVGGTGVTKTTVTPLGSSGNFTKALTGLNSGYTYAYQAYLYDGTTYTYGGVKTFSTTLSAPSNVTNTKACLLDDSGVISWTAPTGSGIKYMVFAVENTTAGTGSPTTGIGDYATVNADFSAATSYGSLGKLLFNGTGTSTSISGLTQGQSYSFRVFAYVDGESSRAFANGTPAGAKAENQTADDDVKTFTSAISNAKVTLTWTHNSNTSCFDEVLIVANQGAVSFSPSGDGSSYTANDVWQNTGNQVVYKGTALTKAITGLTNETEYCFKIFVRRGTSWSDGKSLCATPDITYCNSNGNMDYDTGTTYVKLNTLENSTPTKTQAYTYYTTPTTTLNLGDSYDLEVRVNTAGNYIVHTKVWIDWNRDGDFNDSGEEYTLGTAQNINDAHTSLSPLSISVPITATLGKTRMRVSTRYQNAPTSCSTGFDGEVEDYDLTIVQPTDPEIALKGNNINIPNGFDEPFALNNTLFAQTELGSQSIEKEFTISNYGLNTLLLTGSPAVTLTGNNPGDFVITTQPSSSISGGGSSTFKIKFAPTVTGVRTAIVSIANNDSTENPFTFMIQGTGLCNSTPAVTAFPNSGPINTVIRFTSSTDNLTGATASYNGVAVSALSTSSSHAEFAVPANAINGMMLLQLATGCTFTHNFTVINTALSDCDSGGGSNTYASDLIIYEIYDENGGSGGIISIFNNTGASVDLSSYKLDRAGDYGGSYSTYANLSGSVAQGALAIIGVSGSNCGYTTTGNGSLPGGFNANDGFRLVKNGTTIIDDVKAPNRVGYYLVRSIDHLEPSATYDSSHWTTQDIASGQCLENTVGYAPILKSAPIVSSESFDYVSCKEVVKSVTATEGTAGGSGLTYQWYANDGVSNTWTALSNNATYSGVTTNSLTIQLTPSLENYQYYVRVMEGGTSCYKASTADIIKTAETQSSWNGTSWSNGAPDITKKVTLNNTYDTSVSGSFKACACEVASGVTLTIGDGSNNDYVIISNEIVNNGNIIVKNNANLIQINDVSNTGNITVERISQPMNKTGYTYWGVPVTTTASSIGWFSESVANSGNFNTTANVTTMYQWNPADGTSTPQIGWESFSGGTTITDGSGFIAKAPSNFPTVASNNKQKLKAVFNGVPRNGAITQTVVSNGGDSSSPYGTSKMTYIGNPYPSAIDIDEFFAEYGAGIYGVTTQYVIPTIYLWTHASAPVTNESGTGMVYQSSDFATYTMAGGVGVGGGEEPNGKIASGQGFFIMGTTNQETITLKNSYRYSGTADNPSPHSNNLFFRNQTEATSSFERHRFWLTLEGSNAQYKQILIAYSNFATDQLDGLDGLYYDGGNTTNLYTMLDNKKYTIQAYGMPFEDTDVIPLGFKTNSSGTYNIKLDNFDGLFDQQEIFLRDNLTQTQQKLNDGPYEFVTDSGVFEDRFEIVFRESLNLDNLPSLDNNWIAYTQDGNIHLEGIGFDFQKIEIFDTLGRMIYSQDQVKSHKHTLTNQYAQQVLLIRITTTDNQTSVRKIQN